MLMMSLPLESLALMVQNSVGHLQDAGCRNAVGSLVKTYVNLKECEFRWNIRGDDVYQNMLLLLRKYKAELVQSLVILLICEIQQLMELQN